MLTEVDCLIKTAFYFMFPLMLQSTTVGQTGKNREVFGSWHVSKALHWIILLILCLKIM